LVVNDVLGISSGYVPRFVKAYAHVGDEVRRAVTSFRDEVRDGSFPAKQHGYE
jgi:3-methyl-2-oxobutanoate hydroxymethyltransferase